LAVTLIEKKSSPGIRSTPLLELPLALLLKKTVRSDSRRTLEEGQNQRGFNLPAECRGNL